MVLYYKYINFEFHIPQHLKLKALTTRFYSSKPKAALCIQLRLLPVFMLCTPMALHFLSILNFKIISLKFLIIVCILIGYPYQLSRYFVLLQKPGPILVSCLRFIFLTIFYILLQIQFILPIGAMPYAFLLYFQTQLKFNY